MQLLLNIFFYVEDCVAASGNISMFFKECAATSEKILTTASEKILKEKMCCCFLELCPLNKYFQVKNRLK